VIPADVPSGRRREWGTGSWEKLEGAKSEVGWLLDRVWVVFVR
jgi:hypothetical protein